METGWRQESVRQAETLCGHNQEQIYADHTDDQTAGYVFSAHLLRQPQTDKMMIISKT